MIRPKIAVLASGEGTTADAFIRASVTNLVEPEIKLVITNNKDAGVLKRVKSLNQEFGLSIQTAHIGKTNYPAKSNEHLEHGEQTESEEMAIIELLKVGGYDLVVLMGYMKKVGLKIVNEFGWRKDYKSPYQARLLNTHPGLLPETKGLFGIHIQEFVLEHGLKYAGHVVHVVAEKYDDGPIISRHEVKVRTGDTPETLFERVRVSEKLHLPADINTFINNRKSYISEGVI